ncbi:MSMEG_0570 family nitrogen starvation response protein [Ancylobacter sp. A5.8]|uniref:MSMEG_0570 family nitrogen starvation response protein n=1 Tax=Ancylobacter gelatini TaxID=2919920 RepID=UPI001F4F0CA2|nr:MSMEG_0570 family nitrogen starvation response protein [Ancylobacter gelatini]MCJ8142538.1 MSMEG_0570 family nitrogen starvation response protein [Ancylobacter gelatini]
MPEMIFHIRWPDGTPERCYSPSLVIKDYLTPGESYGLDDFLVRSRTALGIASARVEARYGHPCSLALAQLARIEATAKRFSNAPEPRVTVEAFDA